MKWSGVELAVNSNRVEYLRVGCEMAMSGGNAWTLGPLDLLDLWTSGHWTLDLYSMMVLVGPTGVASLMYLGTLRGIYYSRVYVL